MILCPLRQIRILRAVPDSTRGHSFPVAVSFRLVRKAHGAGKIRGVDIFFTYKYILHFRPLAGASAKLLEITGNHKLALGTAGPVRLSGHLADRFQPLKSDPNLCWVSLGCFNYGKFTGQIPVGKRLFQRRVINTKVLAVVGALGLPGTASWESPSTGPQARQEEVSWQCRCSWSRRVPV